MTGKLIVLEGPDNVGKSTLSAMLEDRLEEMGHICERLAFPGNKEGSVGKLVYKLHHKPEEVGVTVPMHPASIQLLHVAAHVDAIQQIILPRLEQVDYVILDRYWWSAWVYGVAGGVSADEMRQMMELELVFWNDVRPGAVFLIDREAAIIDNTTKHRRDLYRHLASEEKSSYPVCEIENNGTTDEAVQKILNALEEAA